jgi:hypothetical protein
MTTTLINMVREAMHTENTPSEHRTGCSPVLKAIAAVLAERGWGDRRIADALVLEAVRAGGELEVASKRKGGRS